MSYTRIETVRQHNRDTMQAALTANDIAYQLNICLKTARELLKSGEIPGAFRIGKEFRVMPEGVETYIRARRSA